MIIKVLGSGCKKCAQVYSLVNEVLESENISAEVTKIEDFKEIMAYGVMQTPALVINDDVLFVGMVPNKKKILKEIDSRK